MNKKFEKKIVVILAAIGLIILSSIILFIFFKNNTNSKNKANIIESIIYYDNSSNIINTEFNNIPGFNNLQTSNIANNSINISNSKEENIVSNTVNSNTINNLNNNNTVVENNKNQNINNTTNKENLGNNAKSKLNILSVYGDNEAYHPKVLNFPDKWNGYKYWMSYTPYPLGDDSKENPHIAVSNDLINWNTIALLDEPSNYKYQKIYNSDSHIVYNNILNRLECYWRYVDDIENKSIIYRMTSTDGKNWTPKEEALINIPRTEKDCISPAIIFENGIYKMWYVDKENIVKFCVSDNGKNWKDTKTINIKYEKNLKTWHLDVISTEKGYEMIIVAFDKWKNRNDMNLYYTTSKDGINWEICKTILKPTTKTQNWDNKGIYRSSFIYEDDNYYLFYSGVNKEYHRGIGLIGGNNIFELKELKNK